MTFLTDVNAHPERHVRAALRVQFLGRLPRRAQVRVGVVVPAFEERLLLGFGEGLEVLEDRELTAALELCHEVDPREVRVAVGAAAQLDEPRVRRLERADPRRVGRRG
jgi:hypothetical protein